MSEVTTIARKQYSYKQQDYQLLRAFEMGTARNLLISTMKVHFGQNSTADLTGPHSVPRKIPFETERSFSIRNSPENLDSG
jgi:hypothetical protein